jgi:response regulator RpfG family c-di-GMP phosphodiesterase
VRNLAVSRVKKEAAVKKVLLTSSSKAFLARNTNLLMDKVFQFFTAASGSETIKLHQEHLFDLILSELELEDMDGCTLCSEVRKTEPSGPVSVVLICSDTAECLKRVEQSDATAMIIRPINPTQLLVTIGSIIDMQLARSKRVEFIAEVLTKNQDTEFFCISHDISATGILIETEQQLSVGDRVSCLFILGSRHTQAEGEVARCINSLKGKMLYGVKFIDIPSPKRSAIERYVALNDHLGIRLVLESKSTKAD